MGSLTATVSDIVLEGKRNHHVFAGDRFRDQFDDRRRNLASVEADELVAVRFRLCLCDRRTRNIAEPNQGIARADAHIGGHIVRFGELVGADQPLLDEFLKPIRWHGNTSRPHPERV